MKFAIAVLFCAAATKAVEFQIVNKLAHPIWVGILGNAGKPALQNGGFKLNPNQQRSVSSAGDWAGRFWGRTWCDSNTKHCETGDCGNRIQCHGAGGVPPVTLVEITLGGGAAQDYYDISLVDGFNILAKIKPINGRGDCKAVGCKVDLNPNCPNDLKLEGQQVNYTIGCSSSCNKFNTDQYCCRGQYGNPTSCNPNDWQVNSARYFKDNCPDAYSYEYDDASSTFTCAAGVYKITFG